MRCDAGKQRPGLAVTEYLTEAIDAKYMPSLFKARVTQAQ